MCTWYTLSEMSFDRRYHQWANHTNKYKHLPICLEVRKPSWLTLMMFRSRFFQWIFQSFQHMSIYIRTGTLCIWILSMSQHNCIKTNVQFIKTTCFSSPPCIVRIWYRCRRLIFAFHEIVILACASSALNWYQSFEWHRYRFDGLVESNTVLSLLRLVLVESWDNEQHRVCSLAKSVYAIIYDQFV